MNMVLFVREVQSNVFYRVELQICIVGEIVVVGVVFVGRVFSGLEFIIIYIYYIVDVCLVVNVVSWISSDVVVLVFVVVIRVCSMVFFGVSERIDYIQWVVVFFIVVFQVEIVYFVYLVLSVVLCVIVSYSRSRSYGSICGESQNCGQC